MLHMLKSKGHETEPCGTPPPLQSTSKGNEKVSEVRAVMPIGKATKKPV